MRLLIAIFYLFCRSLLAQDQKAGAEYPSVQKVGDRYVLCYITNEGIEREKRVASQRIGLLIADSLEGPYHFHKESLTSNSGEIEDGYAFFENGKIYLLTRFNIEVLQGSTRYRGEKFERPQVLLQNGLPTHLYVASGVNFTGGNGTCSCVLRIQEQ